MDDIDKNGDGKVDINEYIGRRSILCIDLSRSLFYQTRRKYILSVLFKIRLKRQVTPSIHFLILVFF